jgi:hypothetical protein
MKPPREHIIVAPDGYTLRCTTCGWSRLIPRENALARAARVQRAVREHLAEVEAESNRPRRPLKRSTGASSSAHKP